MSTNHDKICLHDFVFYGTHGANPEETVLGQRFRVDVDYWLDTSAAARTDDLEQTVSYSKVYKLVRDEVEGTASKLLEHLAGRVLRAVLGCDPRITEVSVRLVKPNPPLKGSSTGEVSVEMRRGREWLDVLPPHHLPGHENC